MSGKGKGAKRGKPGGPDDVKQLSDKMANLSTSPAEILPLYPLKPQRTSPAPGTVVRLITNLFKLSIKQNKPIFAYSATVEKEEIPKESGDIKKATPPVPRKIASHLRRELLNRAVRIWINQDKHKSYDKSIEFNYIIDRNGTALYALFDLFEKSGAKKKEFSVKYVEEHTFEKGLVEHEEIYRVNIFRGEIEKLKFQDLQDFCNGKGENNITRFQEHLRALNLIMRGKLHTIPINIITPTSVIPFKRENQFELSKGVIGNRGYFMSVRAAECGIVLNVANAHAVFHEENALTDLLRSRFSVRDFNQALRPEIIAKLKKEIYNKQVQATHINYGTAAKPHYRKYRVNDISGSAYDKFTLVDKVSKTSKEITIADYFFKEYKVKLKYPKLPCIVDKGRKVPMEVCSLIEKQSVSRMLLPEETANMIKFAAKRPDEGFNQIRESVNEIKRLDKPAQEFGIDFSPTPIEVSGREIRPTPLVGRAGRDLLPINGEYRPQNEGFLKPVVVKKWKLIFIVDNEAEQMRERNPDKAQGLLMERKFIRSYVYEAKKRGIQIAENALTEFVPFENDVDLKTKLKNIFIKLNEEKFDHGIIFLPTRVPDFVYGYIQYLEVCKQTSRKPGENYTRTSCIKLDNYWKKIVNDQRGGTMFISNLLLKYNTKLGGVNFALKNDSSKKYLQDGYIFISVDVCHPAPGDRLIQSVAAVVGMWDLTGPQMSYSTKIRVQKKQRSDHSTIEEVGEIDRMFEDVLMSYKQKKRNFPSKIMVLRDGVSEGQLKIVLEEELRKVKSMIRRIYGAYKSNLPLMSCLVVQKRHKVCFKRVVPLTTPRGSDYNIQPGTVVDSTITHPKDFCFYLAPHKAIQGTSRPAHIYMILDEIKFSQDEAQAMVHALSYLSPRCTKGTSIPTPVNLADLAAERGKNIVISWNDENHRLKLSEDERFAKINEFLSNLADAEYKNTLFYV